MLEYIGVNTFLSEGFELIAVWSGVGIVNNTTTPVNLKM